MEVIAYDDGIARLLVGDVLEQLATLPDESVHCVVTSPPYWGLRDYGVEGQIGLEPTPEAYIERMVGVFREVRRVLRRDGTLWLNMGDCYATSPNGNKPGEHSTSSLTNPQRQERVRPKAAHPHREDDRTFRDKPFSSIVGGLKPKDLALMPFRLAAALQEPYYTGRIRKEANRAWLAAMIDGEGCIYIARSKAGQRTGRRNPLTGEQSQRTQDAFTPAVKVANTSKALVERCALIVGGGSIAHRRRAGQRDWYEWTLWGGARELLRELYPHLIDKQRQARIAYGVGPSGVDACAAWEAMKALHNGRDTTVDAPPPPTLVEPGWYLRADIVWAKPNPMPESVTDRPTKAHEHLFLLTRSPRYFYDAEAVREPHGEGTKFGDKFVRQVARQRERDGGAIIPHFESPTPGVARLGSTTADRYLHPAGRNLRSVWTIPTQPYPEAHFATFPEELPRRCILAGTSAKGCCPECGAPWARVVDPTYDTEGRTTNGPRSVERRHETAGFAVRAVKQTTTTGWQPTCAHASEPVPCTVLDPFAGSGTTLAVAKSLDRRSIGIELKPDYARLAAKRIAKAMAQMTIAETA